MTQVHCRDCRHFKQAPYDARKTGCYHPENMPQKHKEAFLDEQQIPGDSYTINLRGDCAQFEVQPAGLPWWRRLLATLQPDMNEAGSSDSLEVAGEQ